jgi:hypothetical protein
VECQSVGRRGWEGGRWVDNEVPYKGPQRHTRTIVTSQAPDNNELVQVNIRKNLPCNR